MAKHSFPFTSNLLETRDIIGFSADYLMQNIHQFNLEYEREVMYTICSNLYRAEHSMELELLASGQYVRDRVYSPQSFKDVSYLNIKISEVVEQFVEKMKNDGELTHYRKIL